jgi:hypothetical protein
MFRVSFGPLTFIGLLTLGALPEVWRASDDLFRLSPGNPMTGPEWGAQGWCCGCCLHVMAPIMAAVLFLNQGVAGT